MLESFIQAQKYSVMRSLRREFAEYINRARDFNELLLYALHSLVQDAKHFMRVKYRDEPARLGDVVKLSVSELRNSAAKLSLSSHVSAFLDSEAFTSNGYTYDRAEQVITTPWM
eukprot:PLAT12895.2.p1 GENE.PLAT12895.2~~PLAT12895.2.p1  ORF type:complete len:114 (+),score=53.32 PLAT12895.2:110-451(+)